MQKQRWMTVEFHSPLTTECSGGEPPSFFLVSLFLGIFHKGITKLSKGINLLYLICLLYWKDLVFDALLLIRKNLEYEVLVEITGLTLKIYYREWMCTSTYWLDWNAEPQSKVDLIHFHMEMKYLKFIGSLYDDIHCKMLLTSSWCLCSLGQKKIICVLSHTHLLTLSIYGSTALVDLGPLFSFLIYTQTVGILGLGISPSQGLYLHTEQHKHRINAHKHTCLESYSNPRSQCCSGRRHFML
jgi:hypothetical protein